jgi:hypothetical protein
MLGADVRVAAIGTLFGALLWWVSVFRWYHTAGMVSFVFVSFFALPFIALIHRWLRQPKGTRFLVMIGVFGAIGFLCHPLFPLPIAVWTIVYLAFTWRDQNRARVIALLLVVAKLVLVANDFCAEQRRGRRGRGPPGRGRWKPRMDGTSGAMAR